MSEKKTIPVPSIMEGVTSAAAPVAVEKLPMNTEYWLGSGNCCFNFDFQVTS